MVDVLCSHHIPRSIVLPQHSLESQRMKLRNGIRRFSVKTRLSKTSQQKTWKKWKNNCYKVIIYIYTLSVSTLNSQQESDLLIFHKKKRDASLVQLGREHGTSGVRINQNDNQTAACGCLSVLRRTLVHGEDTNGMSSLLRVDCGLRGMLHFGHQTLVS